MAREILGHVDCPECELKGAAEVKLQKNGLAYRWCTDCHAQYFPRSKEASNRLLAKCGAAKPVTVPETKAGSVPVPEKAPAPKAKPKAASPFDLLGQFNRAKA